jgi:glycosyltransferase involved in cell wall biosynthesis
LRILFAAANVPNPTGKGYQVRLFNQIVHLERRHRVSLVTFARRDEIIEPALARACRTLRVIRRSTQAAGLGAIANALRLPLSVALYQDAQMGAHIRETVRATEADLVVLQLVRMATYIDAAGALPVVLDLMDAAGLGMRERAQLAPAGVRPLMEIEARRLSRFERRAIEKATLSLLISERDRAYVGVESKTRINPNGVDPVVSAPTDAARRPTTVVFSGTMSYPPNADAALWFVTSILPLVRQGAPDVKFRIVGRNPSRALTRVAAASDVVVTGAVRNVSEELSSAALAVCPVRHGSGIQTKVLEAMAAGTPVVGTSKAVEGLPRELARHVLVADAEGDFARAVVSTLRQPSAGRDRAVRALRAIEASHTWRHSVSELESFYAEALALPRRTE